MPKTGAPKGCPLHDSNQHHLKQLRISAVNLYIQMEVVMIDAFCTSGSSPTEGGADFRCENHHSLFLLYPLTPTAHSWTKQHLPENAQWFGNAVVIEHRYIWAILDRIQNDGLKVSR